MGQIHEDPARADAVGDLYQECVQELQRPWPGYAKIQALATLSLAETLREVASSAVRSFWRNDVDSPGEPGPNPGQPGRVGFDPDGPLRVRCTGGGAMAPLLRHQH